MTLNLGDQPTKKPFKSPFTALISRLDGSEHNIPKEAAIIKQILKRGYKDKDIDKACNYLKFKDIKIKSFAFLLWKECKILKEALDDTEWMKENKQEIIKLSNQDFRSNKDCIKPKKNMKDFLS